MVTLESDGKVTISTELDNSGFARGAKSMRSQATSLAAEYRKSGMSMSEAMKKAWSEVERTSKASSKRAGKHLSDNIGEGVQKTVGQLGGLQAVLGRLATAIGAAFALHKIVEFGKESVDAARELSDAMTGLQSIMDGQGRSFAGAQKFVEEYTADGLVPMANAVSAYKNLALRGYDDNQIQTVMTALKDAAAFGRQSSYSMGEAVQSATEGLKNENSVLVDNAGVTKNVAQMWDDYAASIGTTAANLTQQQKIQAEVNGILEESKYQTGDAAKVAGTLSGQLMQLSFNFNSLKVAVGNAIAPILQALLPLINRAITALTQLANTIAAVMAAIFGKASLQGSGLAQQNEAIADSAAAGAAAEEKLASSTKAAGKAAKASLAGFDELNKLQDRSTSGGSSGGSGGSSGGSSSGSPAATTEMQVEDTVSPKVQAIVDKVRDVIDWVRTNMDFVKGAILGAGLGLAAWSISPNLVSGIKNVLEHLKSISSAILLIAGSAALVGGTFDSWQNGLDLGNFTTMIGGAAAVVGGLAIKFGSVGAMAGSTISGLTLFVTGIKDAVTNGLNLLNGVLIPLGSTLSGAGIGAAIGALGGPIGAAVGALIGLIIGLLTDLIIWITQNWGEIVQFFEDVWNDIAGFFESLWDDIVEIWNTCADWFHENVITPVVDFFKGLWEDITGFAAECWNGIVAVFSPVIDWFSELFHSVWQTISDVFYNIGVIAKGCWDVIEAAWSIVSGWFNENVIQPVGSFFSGLWDKVKSLAISAWDGIKSVFSTIGSWINTHIIEPVGNFFSGLWDGFLEKAKAAWDGVKSVFGKVASFFKDTFQQAWQGIVNVFSVAGEIFVDIKDGILSGFKKVVNGIIDGLNSAIAVPFNGINWALNKIKNINILGLTPFSGLRTISIPQIPKLAQGAVIPPNKEFLAVLGDQKRGTNVEAPLETIQSAVSAVMSDFVDSNIAGHEATLAVLRAILEAVLGIRIGDEDIYAAVARHRSKIAVITGGAV